MDSSALLNHFVNFFAPALFMAGVMALYARLFMRRPRPGAFPLALQFVVNAAATGAGLVGGLLVFGADGKVAGYTLAVGACALSQWVVSGDWRRGAPAVPVSAGRPAKKRRSGR